MGFFTSRQKVHLDDFCRDFYETQLLHPLAGGINLAQTFAETISRSITGGDPQFADIDLEHLMAELTAIRFEIFGLAWLHQQGDKRAAEQSDFTRLYLDSLSRTDIWEAMEPYNQAIAQSSTLGQSSETRTGLSYLTFVNGMRSDLFELWCAKGFESTAVARAANRISTDVAWKQGRTAFYMMRAACDRLGCQLNKQGEFQFTAIISGFYDGASQSLKAVKIVK